MSSINTKVCDACRKPAHEGTTWRHFPELIVETDRSPALSDFGDSLTFDDQRCRRMHFCPDCWVKVVQALLGILRP